MPLPPAATATSLHWTDAFLLGYAPMDDVHREFVDLVARMQDATDTDIAGLLGAFAAHAQAHFDTEDRWMRDTGFPALECHIDEHAAVLRSVAEVQTLVAQGNVAICRDLARELAAWFPGHADYLDSALAHWMCKQRLGGKPVVLRRDVALR
jgi:hemerythrin-like metal-binding protein